MVDGAMSKKLRAVGYCRTSSESQRDNTSIPSQKEAIERFVTSNGWTFVGYYVDECKSGSKIEGRDEFQRMMRDAANREFDVLVPFDTTRFGRDGFDILTSAKTLKRDFGVDVVDTKGGFDTRDRRRSIINFVNAGIAEDERVRILERTKKGKLATQDRPHGPKRPFGRVWDAKTKTWSVDPAKQALVEDVTRRYLAGESLAKLAREYGVNHSNLHKVLTKRCGDTWEQRVRCAELGIDETVTTKVPRLLSDETIRAILARVDANRTYLHGHAKHSYLLGHFVYCGHCGCALSGQTNKGGGRYYRHTRNAAATCKRGRVKVWVNAAELEDAVFRGLFDLFGNADAMRRAVEDAVPNRDTIADLQQRHERVASELASVHDAKERLVRFIVKGTLTEDEATKELDGLRSREAALQEEQERLQAELADVPTTDEVEVTATRYFAVCRARRYDKMTQDDKRALAEMVFGAKMARGERLGVYVSWLDGEERRHSKVWAFRVVGRLVDEQGRTAHDAVNAEDDDWPLAPRQKELLRSVSQSASC
jgi:DNA invertase Pin-like site-specific DNA recombinase